MTRAKKGAPLGIARASSGAPTPAPLKPNRTRARNTQHLPTPPGESAPLRKSRSGPSGPTLSEERRRELGQGRLTIRGLSTDWIARFDALCERAKHSRAEHLKGMIQAEEAELADLDRQKR